MRRYFLLLISLGIISCSHVKNNQTPRYPGILDSNHSHAFKMEDLARDQ